MDYKRLVVKESDEEIIARFFPPVGAWWREKFGGLTAPQRMAVPAIRERRHTLVCSPTGSGKTLSAFISVLSELFARRETGTLGGGIECVYVSPLRALGTDVARNLTGPLGEIGGAGRSPEPATRSQNERTLRVALRTGDTTAAERRKMAKEPPEILVTTPESLALCLAQQSMRGHLRGVRTIIIDELHSLAGNKRGVDLMLTVERLSAWVKESGGEMVRIGLSATISPLEKMAEFLVGPARACAIADASFDRPMELEVWGPFGKTPFARGGAISKNVYDKLEEIIRDNRTTLVFTNTRAATERVVWNMRKRLVGEGGESGQEPQAGSRKPEDAGLTVDSIEAHHSSLDREMRLDVEDRLKRGVLRCVVCSTSLELGIDIGSIDRVVLLNSPKGVARGLQRVGRSGHSHGGTSRGTFIPTVPADLVESVVTAEMMRRRKLDEIRVPRNCMDVLAQHLVGMAVAGAERGVDVENAYAIVRQTMAFAELPRADFDACVRFVSGREGAGVLLESGGVAGDVPAQRLRIARRSAAGLYYQNVGTIASEGTVRVKWMEGGVIGTVEESFATMLKEGDRFVLGGRCVRFCGSEGMTAFVTPSDGQLPTVPRWFSGQMSMEAGLAGQMREFRAKVRAIAPAGEKAISRMLMRQWRVDEDVARVCAKYLHVQFRYADIPLEDELLVERVPDEGATALVFHTMIGRAANEALARLVARRMQQRFGPRGVKETAGGGGAAVVVDDYAFGVWVTESSAARRADRALVRSLLSPDGFDEDLRVAVDASELFKTQFRFAAVRGHAILQNRFGRRRFIGQLQGTASRLLEALLASDPEHPLIRETRRTVMEDILSVPAAKAFLEKQSGRGLRLLDLPSPSPFAFGLFASGRRDSLQLADTSDFLLAMYEQIQRRMAKETAVAVADGMLF